MSINTEAPHQAVVLVKAEIHERDEMGRCKAMPSHKTSEVFVFQGATYDETKQQVDNFLERLKNA